MDFTTALHFAQTGGLIYFLLLFAGVLVYAFRPRAKASFDHAARIPLSED
jgi:cytochrome c oxidase cbb3-type subunit IV